MGERSTIEWTEATWNPITGCTKVTPGCAYCYAERITLRMGGSPFLPGKNEIRPRPERLTWPLKWKRPKLIFTCSMTDLFHEDVPFTFLAETFDVMRKAQWHTFQVLTKRPERMKQFFAGYGAPPGNAWLGTSVENQRFIRRRLDALLAIAGKVKFVSCEPLLGPVDLQPWIGRGLTWVILGGESGGPEARRLVEKTAAGWVPKPEALQWARSLRDQCRDGGTSFFFKQWGGPRPTSGGRLLDGELWDQSPQRADECTLSA